MKKIFFLLFTGLFFSSCATKDEIVYFQGHEELEGLENVLNYEPIIQRNDVLNVNVYSLNPEVVAPFQMRGIQNSGGGGNFGGSGSGSMGSSASSRGSSSNGGGMTGYLVDSKGFIQFPVLGKLKVAELKISEVEQMLQEEIRAYVTDAVVNVRLGNFTVTVLGEVNATVPVNDGRISMPELLATAGGIPYTAKRENILIVREINGVKTYGKVDMTETDVFSSPYYYLRQNDIVYIEPTYRQVKSAGFIQGYTGLISLATTIFSLIVLITR